MKSLASNSSYINERGVYKAHLDHTDSVFVRPTHESRMLKLINRYIIRHYSDQKFKGNLIGLYLKLSIMYFWSIFWCQYALPFSLEKSIIYFILRIAWNIPISSLRGPTAPHTTIWALKLTSLVYCQTLSQVLGDIDHTVILYHWDKYLSYPRDINFS